MPVDMKDLIDILAEICENRNLKASLKKSCKGAVGTGIAAGLGGLLLGPIGLAIGGIVGGVSAALLTTEFKPVPVILKNLSPREKEKLFKRIQYAFRKFGAQDVIAITTLIMSQASFKEIAFKEVKNFLTQDLSYILGN